jgi:hypothetical protein
MGETSHKDGEIVIIFVSLGPKFPQYLAENLLRTQQIFKSNKVVLVTDSIRTHPKIKGIEQFLVGNLEDKYLKVISSIKRDTNFRSGFWKFTILRYFALHEYFLMHGKSKILYVESDVWLSKNFPIKKFEGCDYMAFPCSAINQGVASTLFLPSIEISEKFINFIEKYLLDFPKATDNDILGSALLTLDSKTIRLLPSFLSDANAYSDYLNNQTLMGIERFGGIFDAASWGQYLTGLDPLNSNGQREIYLDQLHHFVQPSRFEIEITDSDAILIKKGDQSQELFSLHIHSKDIRVFKNLEFIRKRIKNNTKKPLIEVDYPIYLKMLMRRVVVKTSRLFK